MQIHKKIPGKANPQKSRPDRSQSTKRSLVLPFQGYMRRDKEA
jgi:hypothetical protein